MFPFGNGRLARLTHTLSLSYFHTKKETREEDDKLNQLAYIFLPFDYLNRTISTGPISTSPGSFKKKKKNGCFSLFSLALSSVPPFLFLFFAVKAMLSLASCGGHLIGSVEITFCAL